jgi:peptidoglycan hydrolase FlgJ
MSLSAVSALSSATPMNAPSAGDDKLRETFRQFVGEAVFTQLISSMRKTVQEPAYFHGGQAEKTFQAQLDQQLAQEITKSSADKFADPMFDLFMLQRS